MKEINSQAGFTILEQILTLGISMMLFAAIITQYTFALHSSYNQLQREETDGLAKGVLELMTSELRILGNGVPFDQSNFQINESTLSDRSAADPLHPTESTATQISFRLNELGEVHVLTADFNPASSLNITLDNVTGLEVGDTLYLTNSTVALDDGFKGEITAVNTLASQVTIGGTYVMSPGATFPTGSLAEEVTEITYASDPVAGGITRDTGDGPVIFGPNGTFTVDYLDADGNDIAVPFTRVTMANTLRAVRINVSITSRKRLTTGGYYTADVSRVVGLRNMNYVF